LSRVVVEVDTFPFEPIDCADRDVAMALDEEIRELRRGGPSEPSRRPFLSGTLRTIRRPSFDSSSYVAVDVDDVVDSGGWFPLARLTPGMAPAPARKTEVVGGVKRELDVEAWPW
jgi:hypothetical protein